MNDKISVLFVDDDEMNCKVFKRFFSKIKDFEVTTALSAMEAIDIIKSGRVDFDIVITDQKMPKIKGDELLRYCKSNAPNIFRALTSANHEEIELLYNQNDTNGLIQHYFEKPWNFELIKDVIYSSQLERLLN